MKDLNNMRGILLQVIVFVVAFCGTDIALYAAMSSSNSYIDREHGAEWQARIQQERKKRAEEAEAARRAFPVTDEAVAVQRRQVFAEVLEQEGRENPFSWKMPWGKIGKVSLGVAALGTFMWWLQRHSHNFQEKFAYQNFVALVKKHPGKSVVVGGCSAVLAWWLCRAIKHYNTKPQELPVALPDGEPYVLREVRSQARMAVASVTIEPPMQPMPPSILMNNVPVQQDVGQVKKDTPCECPACRNAREHFKTILMRGTPEELDSLGNEYLHGTAGPKQGRVKKAFVLFTVAASRGLPMARHNLGHCYFNGFGVAKDTSKAFELFFDLDKEGTATRETQLYLGICYLRGSGVRKNLSKALSYFRSAADNGDIDAQLLMCHILRKGIFVSKDEALANTYFEQIKKVVGTEVAAREKLNKHKLPYNDFNQLTTKRGCTGEECSICVGGRPPFQADDFIAILPCEHYFCQDCLVKWFSQQLGESKPMTCPCCREVVNADQILAGTAI